MSLWISFVTQVSQFIATLSQRVCTALHVSLDRQRDLWILLFDQFAKYLSSVEHFEQQTFVPTETDICRIFRTTYLSDAFQTSLRVVSLNELCYFDGTLILVYSSINASAALEFYYDVVLSMQSLYSLNFGNKFSEVHQILRT